MSYGKDYYEKLITESCLFSLDKLKNSTAFRREAYKLVEYLYCYLMAQSTSKYEPFGCEITEVATRCINNYSVEKGPFLHYFNAAWKLEYSHICGDQAVDDRFHGIKLTDAEKRKLKRYLRYEASLGKDLSKKDFYEKLVKLMGLPLEAIEEIAALADYRASDNVIAVDDGDGISLFDQIADGHLTEEAMLSADSIRDTLSAVEAVFLSLQQRQRSIISDMITIRTASVIVELGLDTSEYTFINKEILQSCLCGEALPTQRAIADKYKKNEASISRSVKEFIRKLDDLLKQKG